VCAGQSRQDHDSRDLPPDRSTLVPEGSKLATASARKALQTCSDGRDAITKHMLALSTHLGHSTVANTYWFLEAVPELMRDSAEQTE
jgi:hypothetical protein